MSAHVLLNLLNKLGKSDKMRGSVEANNMDPVWSEFILFQYRLPKKICRQEEQTTKCVNCGLRFKCVYFRDLCQSVA